MLEIKNSSKVNGISIIMIVYSQVGKCKVPLANQCQKVSHFSCNISVPEIVFSIKHMFI